MWADSRGDRFGLDEISQDPCSHHNSRKFRGLWRPCCTPQYSAKRPRKSLNSDCARSVVSYIGLVHRSRTSVSVSYTDYCGLGLALYRRASHSHRGVCTCSCTSFPVLPSEARDKRSCSAGGLQGDGRRLLPLLGSGCLHQTMLQVKQCLSQTRTKAIFRITPISQLPFATPLART